MFPINNHILAVLCKFLLTKFLKMIIRDPRIAVL